MQVSESLQKAGFSVSQSTYYLDPELGIAREIDIVATQGLLAGDTFAHIKYVIECKKSRNKPWIIFTRKNEIFDWEYTEWYCTNDEGWDYLTHAAIDGKTDKLPLNYHLRDRVEYGVTTAFTTGEDTAYKAIQTSVRCAISYIEKTKSRQSLGSAEIVVPVIVIDGLLFDSYLSESGEIVVNRIEEGVVLWQGIVSGHSGVAVHIVTKPYLGNFVDNAAETATALLSDWKDNLEIILDDMQDARSESLLDDETED